MIIQSPQSGGSFLNLQCPARVRHCLHLLVRVVDWCASRLVGLIWTTSGPRCVNIHIGILIRLLAAEPRCTAMSIFPSQCACGTILLTLYSMVWDWMVSRAEPKLIYWLVCFSLLSVFRLVLWSWGLWTYRV